MVVRACVRVSKKAYVHVSACACVCLCVCAGVHVCEFICVYVWGVSRGGWRLGWYVVNVRVIRLFNIKYIL